MLNCTHLTILWLMFYCTAHCVRTGNLHHWAHSFLANGAGLTDFSRIVLNKVESFYSIANTIRNLYPWTHLKPGSTGCHLGAKVMFSNVTYYLIAYYFILFLYGIYACSLISYVLFQNAVRIVWFHMFYFSMQNILQHAKCFICYVEYFYLVSGFK